MKSLRRRLVAWLLPPLVVVGVAAGTGAYIFLERRLTAAYDLDLSDIAHTIIPYLNAKDGAIALVFNPQAEAVLRADSTDQIRYVVLDAQGRVVAGDASLPRAPFVPSATPQFWDGEHLGQRIRAVALAAMVDGTPVQIVATETRRKRDLAALESALSALVPALLLSIAAILAVLLGVRRGLGPVEELRKQVQSRSHVDLRPVEEGGVVEELQPLVRELNDMLKRLESAQGVQARFIANAAHQLRTPIAGLSTHLDLAASGDVAARATHLAHAREAALRLSRLAQQILSLASADPISNPAVPQQPCDLAGIVRDHAGPWLRAVTPRGVEMEFDLEPAPISGNSVLVGELASNLVDNAARYGAKMVKVATGRVDARSVLEVSDDGPGIPADQRTLIFERFRRLDNESTEGSGLGLAIVKEIAQRHGAAITVDDADAGGGTRVSVSFPAPPGTEKQAELA
jgi:two-component system sensor histidine kinase TctE